jgi:hypothetical protein
MRYRGVTYLKGCIALADQELNAIVDQRKVELHTDALEEEATVASNTSTSLEISTIDHVDQITMRVAVLNDLGLTVKLDDAVIFLLVQYKSNSSNDNNIDNQHQIENEHQHLLAMMFSTTIVPHPC